MVAQSHPPSYAWDWFARQRPLWREVRRRLALGPHPGAAAYRAAETKGDVLALLRVDYPQHALVRSTVRKVVAELGFLGRLDVPFERLGVRSPPRGMRWWWTSLTGEPLDRPGPPPARPPARQLSLYEVHEGFGG